MRKFNFYPGPSTIPQPVLEAMREEFLEYGTSGAAFIELSHRSPTVVACFERITAALRALLEVGPEYHVLLLPGGAMGQTAAVPMNLLRGRKRAAYAITGHWSKLAAEQAASYCEVVPCVDTHPSGCNSIPDPASWEVPADCAYLHYTDNETIHGVEFPQPPARDDFILVADQSSNILSRPYPTTKLGLLYACLQKNLGPSGLAVVVVRAELCDNKLSSTPKIWDYDLQARLQSMANTAATFQFRMLELMLDWLRSNGGPDAMGTRNRAKAERLYACIDNSSFYANRVAPAVRSNMNVPFSLADPGREQAFLSGAEKTGLIGLKGHRAVGGMRASIYNAMPLEGVATLIEYMREFERSQT